MLKKMVLLGVIGFVAVSAVRGTKIGSYIRSEISAAREAAESSIPPEEEITRLRNELKLLDKDTMAVVNQTAKERVAVRELQAQVDDRTAKQGNDKELLNARIEKLEKATGQVTFGARTLSVAEAQKELEADVKRFKACQKEVDSLTALLANRVKIRDSLEKQLEAMKVQKEELTATLNGMEAELAALKLQQTESKYQTDDTRLAKIKDDLRKLKTKVEVEREKLNLLPVALDPATPAASGKSLGDLKSELNGPAKPAAKPEGTKTDAKMPTAD
jgi:chromosome segregation ATPase